MRVFLPDMGAAALLRRDWKMGTKQAEIPLSVFTSNIQNDPIDDKDKAVVVVCPLYSEADSVKRIIDLGTMVTSLSPHPHSKICLNMNKNVNRFLASAVVGVSLFLPCPNCGGVLAAALADDAVVGVVKTAVDAEIKMPRRRAPIDVIGRVTDSEIALIELGQDVKTIIRDMADTKFQMFVLVVLGTFIFNKRMDDDKAEAKTRMDADKAEAKTRMDADKAEADKKMDAADTRMLVTFVITSGIIVAVILKE